MHFEGTAGDDNLVGTSQGDTLLGRDGNDVLVGGAGNDFLNGGSGADIYVISPNSGTDTLSFNFRTFEGDKIGLAGGLTYESLTITQSVLSIDGIWTFDIVDINFGNETLVHYVGSLPSESDFVIWS